MSRSWERKVSKNMSQLNKQRKKQGQAILGTTNTSTSDGDVFKGRKYVLPIILLALAVLYALLGLATVDAGTGSKTMNYIGVSLYILLALMIFLRKPYLKVGRSTVSTFKFNRERKLTASEISKIRILQGSVVIENKARGGNWVFSRLINRYDTKAMGERLEQFAKVNNIPVEHE
ncbi:hypothetical protein SAMN05661091_3389 [Paenibacillus uliginis N3/975]|uniref:Methyltransferase n=1 Tax=Paenibacillus uliginis N3/975 TaxID=1313296 RepID=A0A1X7HI73_9BACL|nr:hypothetical protein [Paenibacillus uliginis]SMF86435.1 hypothetical protein SAMN05661091_3389 [Paenibacillus uliginis N3/975]